MTRKEKQYLISTILLYNLFGAMVVIEQILPKGNIVVATVMLLSFISAFILGLLFVNTK